MPPSIYEKHFPSKSFVSIAPRALSEQVINTRNEEQAKQQPKTKIQKEYKNFP